MTELEVDPGLLALVEANAWTYGPNATALRVLELTRREQVAPELLWEPLLARCPRMAPLGYWLQVHTEDRIPLPELEQDFLRRERLLVEHLAAQLHGSENILLAGHDRELEQLWAVEPSGRHYRYLLLEGPSGVPSPGEGREHRTDSVQVGPPFSFNQLEEALDWADAVILAGFVIHRSNLLGPSQLRPLLLSARDQVQQVVLTATNERRLTLGEGSPRRYCEDFRPYLWQEAVTHLVSEWQDQRPGPRPSWLPMPLEQLESEGGESLVE